MAKATLLITGELLRQILHLPIDTSVLGSEFSTDYVKVIVDHPDIPAAEGQIVTPTLRRQPEVMFEGWGPQKP